MSPDPGPLAPFAPRLAAEWMRDEPDLRHRTIEGTMVFADISGFTRLTERLARQGKEGAELLSDTLDLTFATLLAPAFEDGADLLKWGGDAVLLLFRDEDHAPRAARAAHRMRASLRTLVRDRALPVHAPLRMSIGIHSGAFDAFLVGDPASHRELIVTGHAITRLVEVEQVCGAGQILLSSATAARLPPRLLGDVVDVEGAPARLLRSAPDAGTSPKHTQDGHGVDTIPPGIRAHLEAGGGPPEHRPVAVAFVQFGGIDRLLTDEGEDAAADAVHEVVVAVQRACLEHGVTFFESDIAADGGKIMLTAGAPRSAGRDAERMLRAALAIAGYAGALAVRVGVNAGHVFSGELGPAVRRTYSVKGDAVNLAARLLGRANAGQTVATEQVIGQSRVDVDGEPLPPFLVKGKKVPVHAVVVRDVQADRASLGATRFVGRAEELAVLTDALAAAAEGSGSVVDIVGEPGIGKSRLVSEIAVPPGTRTFLTTVSSYDTATPYAAVGMLLRSVLEIGAHDTVEVAIARLTARVEGSVPDLIPWLPLLGVPLDLELPPTREVAELDEKFRRGRIEDTTVALLGALLDGPTQFVFEDAHVMDEASGSLLHRLEGEAHRRPWCVIITRRDFPEGVVPLVDGPRDRRIELAAIPPDSALELLESAGAAAGSRRILEAMAERAHGNPLFLTALATSAAGAGESNDLPASVEALLLVEIDSLASADRALLRLAAVLGTRFDKDLLVRLHPEPADVVVERLTGFVHPADGGDLEFRHAMVRDVAYAGLPYRLRRELHQRVADTLESAADRVASSDLLSLHFHAAGLHERAWPYSVQAGEDARAKYAYGQAAAFFERALESASHLPELPASERSAAQVSLGDSLDMAGDAGGALLALRRARRDLRGDVVATAEILHKEASIVLRLGRFRSALAQLTRGLRRLDGVEGTAADAVRARLATRYGFCLHLQRRDGEAVRWGRRSVEWAEAAGDQEVLAQAFNALHLAYGASSLEEDRPYGQLALDLYTQLGDLSGQARTLNNLAGDAYTKGSWGQAIDGFAHAAESFHRLGDDANAANALYNQADVLVAQRRYEEALPALRAALPLARRVDDEELVGLVLRELARAEAGTGDQAGAWPLFEQARTVLSGLDLATEVVLLDAARAEALADAGELDRALDRIDQTIAAADAKASETLPRLHRIRAQSLIAQGRHEQAAAAAREGLARSTETYGGYERALLSLTLADATQDRVMRAEARRVLVDLGVAW